MRPDTTIRLTGEQARHAVEVAPRIWWVGCVLDDPFQSHAYLLEAGEQSVLIDPGSSLTIETTLVKIAEVVPIDHLATVVVHHADPDVADGLHRLDALMVRLDARIVTEWRSQTLLRHLALALPFTTVEDLGWRLDLGDDRELRFLLTPYLHFPGAFVSFETSTRALFSADLFGGFNRNGTLWAQGTEAFEDLRQFHEHYMPSRELLMAGLASVQATFRKIDTVLPQHGYLLDGPLVRPMFELLSALECGIMRMSNGDVHLAELLDMASAVRRIDDALASETDAGEVAGTALVQLRRLMPAASIALEVELDGGILTFEMGDGGFGHPVGTWTAEAPDRLVLRLPDDPHEPAAQVVITMAAPFTPLPEATEFLRNLAPRVRRLLSTMLEARATAQALQTLEATALQDPLTGLSNRRYLDEHPMDGHNVVALMVDIDHFKRVNDTCGHATGDEVLRKVASAVRSSVRPTDVVVRWGGEEILVLARASGPMTTFALDLGERIRAAVEAVELPTVPSGRITVSVGTAVNLYHEPIERAIAEADEALYDAKRAGRNCVKLVSVRRRA